MPTPMPGADGRGHETVWRITAIAGGGALGTLARYGTERLLTASPDGIPWGTLAVNLSGSFVLGVIITLVTERWPPTRYIRPFAAIGFCGGFTTFSTLMVEVTQRAQHGQGAEAAAYLLVSLVAGVLVAGAGVVLVRGRSGRAQVIPDPDGLDDLGTERGPGSRTEPPGSPDSHPVTDDERTRQ